MTNEQMRGGLVAAIGYAEQLNRPRTKEELEALLEWFDAAADDLARWRDQCGRRTAQADRLYRKLSDTIGSEAALAFRAGF
jgi:hypothetical protein